MSEDSVPTQKELERARKSTLAINSLSHRMAILENRLANTQDERDDLLAACKLAKQHLDALRIEARIGLWLAEPQRETFRFVDETLTAAIIHKARQ